MTARILLVDDDRAFRLSTAELLRQDGYVVETAADGQEAVEALRGSPFDLMLLDLRMPGLDGTSLVTALRKWGDAIPVLMISGYGTVDAAVHALHAGADDFVSKPVDPMVLLARVRALLRRVEASQAAGEPALDIQLGGLRISETSHRVWLHDEEILLTTQEFELLLELARNAGTILSREALFKRIRGIEYDGLDRSMDGRISKLRRKLNDDADAPARIKTIWGKGYLLAPDAWDGPA